MKRPIKSESDRFWEKVDKTGECWLWIGSRFPNGYGHFHIKNENGKFKTIGAHRFSYQLATGSQVPSDMVVAHKCNVKGCVRPDHLYAATYQQNTLDALKDGIFPTGDRSGSRLHPESRARGDEHWARTNPEKLAIGDNHGYKKHPEKWQRGDQHHSRRNPEKLARGDKNGARTHPEKWKRGDDHWTRLHPEKSLRGAEHGMSKLDDLKVADIKSRILSGEKIAHIARIFEVTPSTIQCIKQEKTWKHVPWPTLPD